MIKTLSYAGKNLAEFSMFFDSSKIYKKPLKQYSGYDIPNRNGKLYQPSNKYSNVIIEYQCYIRENFGENFTALINYLNSFDTYQRLEDTTDPLMYRMALFHIEVNANTGAFLKDGKFTLSFDCKPQEYYADGAEFERIASHYDTYTGDPAVLVNEGESTVTNLKVALNPQQNLNGYDSPWVGGAGKNKLQVSDSVNTRTVNGITFTVERDSNNNVLSITASGTASGGNAILILSTVANMQIFVNEGKQIILSGSPSVGGKARLQWWNHNGNGTTAVDNGNGSPAFIPTSTAGNIAILVYNNETVNNAVFKPMIRLASVTDATYEPYSNICPIYPANGKNLLQITATSQTVNGVTFTVNADGTVKANGTASSAAEFVIKSDVSGNTYAGMILSGCPNGGGGSTYRLFEQVQGSPWTYLANDGGNGVTLPTTTYTTVRFIIRVESGVSVNNLVFKPMIRPASITDSTYVPYQSIMVTRTGKNLFNGQFAYHNADKYSHVLDGETYTVSSKSTGAHQINLQYITKTNTYYGDRKIVSEGDTFGKVTVTIPTDVKGVLIYVNGDASNSQHTAYDTQIELGSSATEYEPYQGQTYTIDLNGTRYGGTVDLATGVLTVDMGYFTLNGSETWTVDNNGARVVTTALRGQIKPNTGNSSTVEGDITNMFLQTTPNMTYGGGTGFSVATNGNIHVCDGSTMTVEGWQSFLASKPLTLAMKLATPQTVQLTPQQISLLTGTNYISGSGEVTVTTRTPLILKNPSPMTAKPIFKFTNISAPFTVSANGETIISFQNAIRLVKGGIVNNMFFNATGTNLIMQKQGTPNYEETSFLINSGWLPAGRYYLATMPIGNLEVTSMDGTHLYSSGGTFTLTDITQVKIWYVITPDASTPQNFNFPIYLRPLGTLYVDSELMDCYMLDGDTAYSFNECVSLPKDFLQLDERTVVTMTSGAVGFIAPNWWRL